MIEFAPRELCEKLKAMGCKSESGFYWGRLKEDRPDQSDSLWIDVHYDGGLIVKRVLPFGLSDGMNVFNQKRDMMFCCQAFAQNDFTGAAEQARKNARIVWGDKLIISAFTDGPKIPNWKDARHGMIVQINETWWQYLERTMKK